MERLLLVEDNADIAEALSFGMQAAGYELSVASNISEAEALVDNQSFGLVLLDVNLPDGNGFDFYKKNLSNGKTPVIFLTARDDENDIVKGLMMGAEDYITKPFSTKELMARIKRIFMRYKKQETLSCGDISFDMEKMEVTKKGVKVELSSLELKIVHLMFLNHDKAVSRDEIIDLIWESTGNDVFDHTVTVYMKRIREKIGEDIIKTIKGIGYRIDIN